MQEDLSFEAAFKQLSEKVEVLEKGGLSLEEATRLFEEGMELVKRCNQLLSQAELKIERLREDYSDVLAREPAPEENGLAEG